MAIINWDINYLLVYLFDFSAFFVLVFDVLLGLMNIQIRFFHIQP